MHVINYYYIFIGKLLLVLQYHSDNHKIIMTVLTCLTLIEKQIKWDSICYWAVAYIMHITSCRHRHVITGKITKNVIFTVP